MERDKSLELSLFLMRISAAAFLLVWAADKLVTPGHAKRVFNVFYFTDPTPEVLLGLGVVQGVVILAFAAGVLKFWTYGAVFLMHLVSTLSTYQKLLMPLAKGNILFWTAVPVVALLLALFLLRDRDRMFALH